MLHYHLSDAAIRAGYGLVRPSDHGDALSLDALQEWLSETGCPVTVRPVWDPAATAAVDRYEIPARLRAALELRNLADVFPYGSLNRRIDVDHTTAYRRHGPPGQTGLHNLGPLARRSHRVATHGRWQKRQPTPGTYLWRSPHGWIWIVTNQGTVNLGRTPFSEAIWRAATLQDGPGPELVRVRRQARRGANSRLSPDRSRCSTISTTVRRT